MLHSYFANGYIVVELCASNERYSVETLENFHVFENIFIFDATDNSNKCSYIMLDYVKNGWSALEIASI